MRQEIINKIDEILEIPKTDFWGGVDDINFNLDIRPNYLAKRLQEWNPSPVSYTMVILSNKCTVFEGRRTLAGNLKITTDNISSLMNSEEIELLKLLKWFLSNGW